MTRVMHATRDSSATSFETPDSLFTALELMFFDSTPSERSHLIHGGSDTAIHIGTDVAYGEPFTRPEFDCE